MEKTKRIGKKNMAEYLAADCLEEIFHYVSVQDLVALSSVSHYYRTVTLKPSLWKHHALKKLLILFFSFFLFLFFFSFILFHFHFGGFRSSITD